MKCSVCKQTELEERSGRYYCPWCNQFFGPVPPKKVINNKPLEFSPFPKEDLSDAKKENKFGLTYFSQIVIVLFLFLGYFLLGFWGHYVSLSPYCVIKIESLREKNNREEIIRSLDDLKKNQPERFALVCNNISKIGEQHCVIDDSRTGGTYGGALSHSDFCYINGTKTVYISPKSYFATVIKDLPEGLESSSKETKLLVHLATLSKKYWDGEER